MKVSTLKREREGGEGVARAEKTHSPRWELWVEIHFNCERCLFVLGDTEEALVKNRVKGHEAIRREVTL